MPVCPGVLVVHRDGTVSCSAPTPHDQWLRADEEIARHRAFVACPELRRAWEGGQDSGSCPRCVPVAPGRAEVPAVY